MYGGTELVAYNLTESLVAMGHEVSLVATGDSHTSAHLLESFPRSLRTDPAAIHYRDRYKYIGVGRVLDLLSGGDFDIVHNHLGWRLLPVTNFIKAPVITTLHGPLNVEQEKLIYGLFADKNYVSISQNQRKPLPELNYVANVYNGIDVSSFTVGGGEDGYLAFLGRISPEKGTVEAIKIAQATGRKLRIAAKVDVVDEDYFENEVKPLIDGKQIVFIGEVKHDEKVKFLGDASALLMPIQWEEPFGLVNVEAMACGTPVIGLARGSLPEIIIDGQVGFLCQSVDEMIKRVADINKIKRSDCRLHVEQNFTSERMAENYLKAYQKLLS